MKITLYCRLLIRFKTKSYIESLDQSQYMSA